MKILISEGLLAALENQMGHEMTNAHIYIFLAGFLNSKGLDKLAKMFESQYEEELGHFKLIYSLVTDLGLTPSIAEIDEVSLQSLGMSDSILSVADKFFEREFLTTSNLGELMLLAVEESNFVVEEFLREMIKKQQHEYEEATDFCDKAKLCGENWMNVLIWNNTLG